MIKPGPRACSMASGDTDLVKALLAEAPVKTPHTKYKQKRVRQLLDAYLEYGTRIAPTGTLGFSLYTFLPNPGRNLKNSWQEAEREWISLKLALQDLSRVGVLCAFLGLETHSPEKHRSKAKDGKAPAPKRRRAGAPGSTEEDLEEGEDLELEDLDTPAPPAPHGAPGTDPAPEGRLHPQALKAHFHAVLIHDLTDLNLRDPGFLNRYLAEKDIGMVAAGSPPRFQVGLWHGSGSGLEGTRGSRLIPTLGRPGEAGFPSEPWADECHMLYIQSEWRQAYGIPPPEVLPFVDEALSAPDLWGLFATLDEILDAADDTPV